MDVLIKSGSPEAQALVKRRQDLGLDGHDEMWDGVYHMTPYARGRHSWTEQRLSYALYPLVEGAGLSLSQGFNLGTPDDYRVPDLGIHAEYQDLVYYPSVLVAIEILSPGDETYEKMDFYSTRVQELWVVDPERRSVKMYEPRLEIGKSLQGTDRSTLLAVSCKDLEARVDWP